MTCQQKHFTVLIVAIFSWLITISAYAADPQKKPLKVGFLAVGPISDLGFNYADNQGRLFLEKELHGQVETTIVEKIPESAEAERVLEKMIAQGNKLIFTVSYGFLEPALRVAARHPDVTFMQINRFQTAKNLGTFFSQQFEPMYLSGMVAGRMTKSNKLGFVGSHPVPPLLQWVNAFTLGARSVNPKVETHVVWINSWSDPALESEAVKGLVETGCDVIAHGQDTQHTLLPVCENLGVYCCGCYSDAHQLAPKEWLTGGKFNWGPFYVKVAKSVMDHTWKPSLVVANMATGYIELSSFGKAVPAAVQKEVLDKEKEIKAGKFVVYKGPIKDRDGKERISPGQIPDLKQLAEMNWFVPGIQGSLK
jgi:basic membrane lipoprotein Med (substrate-binding protein (PBP1-ABC) superfamily)